MVEPAGPPVIPIDGGNLPTISTGPTYSDLGATITGPQADLSFGIHTFVDGTATDPVVNNTTAPGTHTIDYVVTDQAGLTSTSSPISIPQATMRATRSSWEPDTLGLMHGLVVTPASIQDRDMIAPLMTVVRSMCATIQKSLADGGYQGAATATEVLALAGIPLEIVKRSDAAKGFVVLPKRWIVERTFGWLGRCRRLTKDFENHARSHAAFVILAMIRLMLRRIVRLRNES